jgi:hypothetical protein
VTKRKIETILEQLERLGLGEDFEETADAQRPVQHADPLMSATLPRLVRSCTDTFLAPSMGSSASFEGHWVASEAVDYAGNEEDAQVVSDLMDKIRDALTDYQVSVDPKKFLRPPSLNRSSTGRTTESHTRSGSRADCESLNLMVTNMSNR